MKTYYPLYLFINKLYKTLQITNFKFFFFTLRCFFGLRIYYHKKKRPLLIWKIIQLNKIYKNIDNKNMYNNIDRTQDVVFSRFRGFSFTDPEAEAQRSHAHALSRSCNSTRHTLNFFEPLPQGYCERKTPKS